MFRLQKVHSMSWTKRENTQKSQNSYNTPLYSPLKLNSLPTIHSTFIDGTIGALGNKANTRDVFKPENFSVAHFTTEVEGKIDKAAAAAVVHPQTVSYTAMIANTKAVKVMKGLLDPFVKGGKQLVADIQYIRRTKKKMGTPMNRKDWDLYQAVSADMKKAIPLGVLFWLPVIGYLTPLIAMAFPALLPNAFMTQLQKTEKAQQESVFRKENFPKILASMQAHASSPETKLLLDESVAGKLVSNDDLYKHRTEIAKDGHLGSAPRKHLEDLCRLFSIGPQKFLSILPNTYLESKLVRHYEYLKHSDELIFLDANKSFTDEELLQICHIRGIDTFNASTDSLLRFLADWTSFSYQSFVTPAIYYFALPLKINAYK